jgi:hypothetical protein
VLLQDTTTCTGPFVTAGVDLLGDAAAPANGATAAATAAQAPHANGNGDGVATTAPVTAPPPQPARDVAAVINVTAVDTPSPAEQYNFALEESADNVTYTPAPGGLTLVTGAGVTAARARVSKRFVRLALDAKGPAPSITFKAWL